MSSPASHSALVAAGLSSSFAHHILAGTRRCRPSLALWLRDQQGVVVPQLEGLGKRELDGLRALYPPAPPKPRRPSRPAEAA